MQLSIKNVKYYAKLKLSNNFIERATCRGFDLVSSLSVR